MGVAGDSLRWSDEWVRQASDCRPTLTPTKRVRSQLDNNDADPRRFDPITHSDHPATPSGISNANKPRPKYHEPVTSGMRDASIAQAATTASNPKRRISHTVIR